MRVATSWKSTIIADEANDLGRKEAEQCLIKR